MDETDVRILKAMADHGTVSPNDIKEQTNIPKSTIYYRIDKMKEDGTIRNEIFDLDNDLAGLGITIISEVIATYDAEYHTTVGEKLANIDGVSQVYFMMGDTDFIVISQLPDQEHVEDLISSFEGIDEVERTSSQYTISTMKTGGNVFSNYDLETLFAAHDIDATADEL
ncbi:DNA-binding transcriptional regulator, Lrp family [Natronorubrum sediminis]|uniref:DNA-binding transcriptional regulator, Lrp family n=1 Tax=Natronorubrum sediminis TaxID=640943 RepID=A0A1H6FPE4_9EURY|nr:Lrp/AsnC family transcriptional regulator [Natronorubrum sediminis]SEH12789.1 DNA-binding transcriptional regulator, Lrp family [Natronorubrum sediminis]